MYLMHVIKHDTVEFRVGVMQFASQWFLWRWTIVIRKCRTKDEQYQLWFNLCYFVFRPLFFGGKYSGHTLFGSCMSIVTVVCISISVKNQNKKKQMD